MTFRGFKLKHRFRYWLLWFFPVALPASGCSGIAQESAWHRQHGWRAADFFADPQVIALGDAIVANDLNRMKALIAAGSDVNARGKGNMTPLLWAFFDDKPERFRLLLEAGADPNVFTTSDFGDPRTLQPGDSVTHMACRSSSSHFWAVFDHGGKPNLPSKVRGFTGMTPVYLVIKSGAADKAERITRLAELGASLNRAEGVSASPLMTAEAQFGRFDLCLLLLDLGADPTAFEGDGVSQITHILCGRLEDKRRGEGQLSDATPDKMQAFDRLVARLERMGLSMDVAQADRERWAEAGDLITLGEMRRKERQERERRVRRSSTE